MIHFLKITKESIILKLSEDAMSLLQRVVLVGVLVLILGCDKDGDSTTIDSATKFISNTLATSLASRRPFQSRGLSTSNCGSSYQACITPTSVTGKAYYSGMIVGRTNGLSLGPMIGTVKDPSQATTFSQSELLEIDLGQKIQNTGKPTLGGPIAYPEDSNAYVQSFHVYFGWVDTTFALTSNDTGVPATAQGSHVIRQVMANITGTEYQKGDLLYRTTSESAFKYCVSGSGCTSTTRPTTPITNSTIASYASTSEGNKVIPSFYINPDSSTVQVKKSDLENPASTNVFTVDIAMNNGVKFTTAASNWATLDKLVEAFRLPAEPGKSNSGSTFTATISYSAN